MHLSSGLNAAASSFFQLIFMAKNMIALHFQIFSTLAGFIGTVLMFRYSYVLKPYEGAAFAESDTNEKNGRIRRENIRIQKMQKLGIALLSLSFISQGISYFF